MRGGGGGQGKRGDTGESGHVNKSGCDHTQAGRTGPLPVEGNDGVFLGLYQRAIIRNRLAGEAEGRRTLGKKGNKGEKNEEGSGLHSSLIIQGRPVRGGGEGGGGGHVEKKVGGDAASFDSNRGVIILGRLVHHGDGDHVDVDGEASTLKKWHVGSCPLTHTTA